MNKVIITVAVIALGIVSGWYVMGGKGSVPTFPVKVASPATKPTAMPTSEASGLYEFRNQTVTGTPVPTGANSTIPTVTRGSLPVTKTATTTPVPTVKANPTAVVAKYTANVSYTDSGFTPAMLTVKYATKVTFTNNSTKNMWIASAIHPTHKELPGFDQLKSVPKGGTYEYLFVKVGTWKYHNHVLSDHTGVVVVTQ